MSTACFQSTNDLDPVATAPGSDTFVKETRS